jgi:endonuclease YncB( thermonuclease family)
MTDVRLALILLLFLSRVAAQAYSLTGRIVKVTDADTIIILDTDNTQHRIRLQGIDAPERGRAFGTKSKNT